MSSIWLNNLNYKANKSLSKDISVDVLIIGGGITGLSTAYHLRNTSLSVALVERNLIGHGVTSKTTGKLTFLQDIMYSSLASSRTKAISQKYLHSQIEAIKMVSNIISKHKIDCNFELVDSYLFTNTKSEIDKLKKEKNILNEFQIEVEELKKLPDGKKVEYALKVKNTAVFHPLKYLIKLKKICKDKINIYENTKIINISKQDGLFLCQTSSNTIKAKKVVLAMHYPYFLFPYLFPLKTHLEQSYLCAYSTDKNLSFSAITSKKPTLSMRYFEDENNIYKIVLNRSHNLAFKNNNQTSFNNFEKKLAGRQNFMWSNIDIMTGDKLPLIGSIKPNLFLATGYNTWGMTNGSLAGKILSDLIQNKSNEYQTLFDPKRLNIPQIVSYPLNVYSSVKAYFSTKIIKNKSWYSPKVIFKTVNGKQFAIYIDENNKKHIVYNKCPHLKCSLLFNEKELTWDCPCHGSRFDIDGKCIEGPSNYNITYKE